MHINTNTYNRNEMKRSENRKKNKSKWCTQYCFDHVCGTLPLQYSTKNTTVWFVPLFNILASFLLPCSIHIYIWMKAKCNKSHSICDIDWIDEMLDLWTACFVMFKIQIQNKFACISLNCLYHWQKMVYLSHFVRKKNDWTQN